MKLLLEKKQRVTPIYPLTVRISKSDEEVEIFFLIEEESRPKSEERKSMLVNLTFFQGLFFPSKTAVIFISCT